MKIENEWVKRFLLGAALILFAGSVFYIASPKWHYFCDKDGDLSVRYNAITGETWNLDDDYSQARMMKIPLKAVKYL